MEFINLLNETYVAYARRLADSGWELEGDGYEAVSWTGEIRAFTTYREANAWRVEECREALGVAA